jgi:predicted transposase YdaD
MKRDPLFFRLFKELPSCFFELVGRPADAEKYELSAVEYKSAAVRLDGVFRPNTSEVGPAYLWEAQFYPSDTVYANLMIKIGHFLQDDGPDQDWIAVVIYPSRELEQKNLHPYRSLLNCEQLLRIYLNELPPAPPDRFDLGILELIAAKPDAALKKASALVPKVRASKRPPHFKRMVIQFTETVIVY